MQQYTPSQVQPVKKTIVNGDKEVEVFEVVVEGEEYEKCEAQSTNMWANSKTGEWGSGLMNNKDDPRKTERTGNLGEMAFAKVFNLPVDFSYKRGGDDQDFMLFGKHSLNIKNAARNYGQALVKAVTDTGYPVPPKNDIYVFSYIASEDRENKRATVMLVGYEVKDAIVAREKVPAIKGKHLNYAIPYNELKPISRLFEAYQKHQTKKAA